MLAAAILLCADHGATQQPPGMVATAAKTPDTLGGTARMPEVPIVLSGPGVVVPPAVAPGEAPLAVCGERLEGTRDERSGDVNAVQVTEGNAFLLPVWHHGLWAMPPGGLTRFIIQPPLQIDPNETLAPFHVVENES